MCGLPSCLSSRYDCRYADTAAAAERVSFAADAPGADPELDRRIACQLVAHFSQQLKRYKHPLWRDLEIIDDPTATPRQVRIVCPCIVCSGISGTIIVRSVVCPTLQ